MLLGRRTFGKGSVQTVMPLVAGPRHQAHHLALLHALGPLHPGPRHRSRPDFETIDGEPLDLDDRARRARRWQRATPACAPRSNCCKGRKPQAGRTGHDRERGAARRGNDARMELIHWFVDIVLHLDAHLVELLRDYGFWVYLILFAIVFAETGFVVTPFLPGDSLLFAAGALAAVDTSGTLSAPLLSLVLVDRRGRRQHD